MQTRLFHRARRTFGFLSLAAMLAVSVVVGGTMMTKPAAAQAPLNGEFVARLGATDSFAGIVVGQGKVLAYVCNGTDAGVSTYGWFRGDLTGDLLQLTNPNGLVLELAFNHQSNLFDGRFIVADGTFEDFSTARANDDTGLFINEVTNGNQLITGGWIVENNFDFRGQITISELIVGSTDSLLNQPDSPQFAGTGDFDPITHEAFFPLIDQLVVVERVSVDNILDFFDF
ncbi:MAG: hypothetical protein ACRDJE_06060 [Dehalococcoidia bacterium]